MKKNQPHKVDSFLFIVGLKQKAKRLATKTQNRKKITQFTMLTFYLSHLLTF